MAQKWYPVIDYVACVECGTCVNFCPHHVYNKTKAPTPVRRKKKAHLPVLASVVAPLLRWMWPKSQRK